MTAPLEYMPEPPPTAVSTVDFSRFHFHPLVDHEGPWPVLDLTRTYDPDAIEALGFSVGRYDERRESGMYTSALYADGRTLHVGIDLWGPAGTPVYAFYDGVVFATADNAGPGNYGPTVVTRHDLDGVALYALYGHLSRASLDGLRAGRRLRRGARLGTFGKPAENGGWAPHVHFQLAWAPPEGADMPGVLAPADRAEALRRYPDPRLVLGPLYAD